MRVKRFVAPTMRDATAQVWREFGPDALIMQTRRVRQPGVFGLLRPRWVVVMAALDESHSEPRRDGPLEAYPRQEAPTNGALDRDEAAPCVAPSKLHALAVAYLLQRLREQEVAEEYVETLGEKLQGRVGQGGEAPQRHLLALLTQELQVAEPWPVGQQEPLVIPLVGPTGVGKTTTIAKLAATYALTHGYEVGLVTADTYRIAAVEQLRTYAEILNLPLEVVYSPDDMRPALERLQDKHLVLVDTAGRSPYHADQMEELGALLAAMGPSHAHLVLSATTRHADMVEIADRFLACAPVEGLIITKLDETSTYGLVYNAVRRTGLPLAYVTHGQAVPEHLAVADAQELAGLIAGVKK